MELRVALVEALARGGERRQAIRAGSVERRAQLIALAGVAQVELAHETRLRRIEALGRELLARLCFERAENRFRMRGRDLVERLQVGADIVMHHVGA